MSHFIHIIYNIIYIIIGIGIFGNVILGTVWGLYFLLRINELRKKVYYLKKQTDERCLGELNNANVDYIKYIFIAAISAFEVLAYLGLIGGISAQTYLKLPNCSDRDSTYYIEYTYYYPVFRTISALVVTSIIMSVSLIHILTSYLSHAYSEKRITNIMRRERVMFAWLFIQLVCVWCSIFYWPLFMLTLPIMVAIALIGHLYLYWKYGRELYSVIRRRERDALFEDVHSHDKLSEMRWYYKHDSILYFLYIFLFTSAMLTNFTTTFIKAIFLGDCLIKKVVHLDIHALSDKGSEVLFNITDIVGTIFLMLGTSFLFLMYISIMYRQIKKIFKRRFSMNNPTRFSHNTLHQPLIGNK